MTNADLPLEANETFAGEAGSCFNILPKVARSFRMSEFTAMHLKAWPHRCKPGAPAHVFLGVSLCFPDVPSFQALATIKQEVSKGLSRQQLPVLSVGCGKFPVLSVCCAQEKQGPSSHPPPPIPMQPVMLPNLQCPVLTLYKLCSLLGGLKSPAYLGQGGGGMSNALKELSPQIRAKMTIFSKESKVELLPLVGISIIAFQKLSL